MVEQGGDRHDMEARRDKLKIKKAAKKDYDKAPRISRMRGYIKRRCTAYDASNSFQSVSIQHSAFYNKKNLDYSIMKLGALTVLVGLCA